MKKINYLELAAIFLSLLITFNTGINSYILKNDTGTNAWLAVIIAYLIGTIPLMLTIYIANYKPELNIFEKNRNLFKNTLGNIINLIICIILFIIASTILYNIINFITTQFLYHTPIIVSSILIIILSIYCANKNINVIAHVSLILMVLNGIMFIISNLSLINEIKLDNLLPFFKINTNNFLTATLKLTIINTLPMISILIIPKNKITNNQKYKNTLIWTYIISFFISLITITNTISILGIYLTKIFTYSEYMVLKKIKLFGFLERSENIIAMKWITETYIYITLIIYIISKQISPNNEKKFTYSNIIIGILLVLTKYLFKNETVFYNYINNYFIIIVSILLPIYFIISIKIYKERKIKK